MPQFADEARKILQNVPMRMSKPTILLLARYRRHWKLMAKETTIWLHEVNGDPKTGISGKEMRAELFKDEPDDDVIDDPTGMDLGTDSDDEDDPRGEPVEIVIDDPPSNGMPRAYLEGLSDIELFVSSQISRHLTVAIRWQVNGMHTGTLLGQPASGRPVSVGGMTIVKFDQLEEGSKTTFTASEEWTIWDLPSLLEQVGGAP